MRGCSAGHAGSQSMRGSHDANSRVATTSSSATLRRSNGFVAMYPVTMRRSSPARDTSGGVSSTRCRAPPQLSADDRSAIGRPSVTLERTGGAQGIDAAPTGCGALAGGGRSRTAAASGAWLLAGFESNASEVAATNDKFVASGPPRGRRQGRARLIDLPHGLSSFRFSLGAALGLRRRSRHRCRCLW